MFFFRAANKTCQLIPRQTPNTWTPRQLMARQRSFRPLMPRQRSLEPGSHSHGTATVTGQVAIFIAGQLDQWFAVGVCGMVCSPRISCAAHMCAVLHTASEVNSCCPSLTGACGGHSPVPLADQPGRPHGCRRNHQFPAAARHPGSFPLSVPHAAAWHWPAPQPNPMQRPCAVWLCSQLQYSTGMAENPVGKPADGVYGWPIGMWPSQVRSVCIVP